MSVSFGCGRVGLNSPPCFLRNHFLMELLHTHTRSHLYTDRRECVLYKMCTPIVRKCMHRISNIVCEKEEITQGKGLLTTEIR